MTLPTTHRRLSPSTGQAATVRLPASGTYAQQIAGRLTAYFVLLLLLLGGTSLQAQAQTVIFHANTSVLPGEALSVQGNFGASAVVYLAPAAAPGSSQVLPIRAQRFGHATVHVPATLPLDVYEVWVLDQGQRSPSVWVNRPQGQHFDSPEITPGSRMRLFGRNLMLAGSTPQVRFAAQNGGGGSGQAQIIAASSDAYKLQFTVPTTLVPGTRYDVYVSNGRGTETLAEQSVLAIASGTDYFQLGVPWAVKFDFYNNSYNIRTDTRLSIRAVGNGQANDLPALQAAVDQVSAAGGGVVYLPAGTYKMVLNAGGGLYMRNRVVLRGDGATQTHLQYGSGTPALDRWGLIWANVQQGGLADLSVTNVNTSGLWDQNMTGSGTEVFMARVRYALSTGSWLWWANSNKVLLRDCNFTQGIPATSGYHGPIQLNGCSNFLVAGNTFTYAVDGLNFNQAHEGVVENNIVHRDGSARYPTFLVNHVLIFNFAYNIAVLNNELDVINGPAQNSNDGEAIIAEGGGPDQIDEEAGFITGVTATTLSDNAKNWGAMRLHPVVAIVSGPGMGQWRKIVSRSGNTLTLDRPWTVMPAAGGHYAIFNWGARNWVVQGNTMRGHRRGITIYHNATTDVALVNNTLINSGSIDLTPKQIPNNGIRFVPIYDTQIIGNSVSNLDGSNGVFIGVHTVQHIETRTFGTSVIGLEVRRNTLTAHVPNTPAIVDDVFPEGYLNYLEFHSGGFDYNDQQIPVVLGSIFQDNTAINCNNAMYLNSGSYNTLVCNTNLVNSPNLLSDIRLDSVSHASVGTSYCPLLPVADPKNNPTISRGATSAPLVAMTGSDPNPSGQIVGFKLATLPPANEGVVYLNGAPAVAGIMLPATQANQLSFQPANGYVGTSSFTYTSINNQGFISSAVPFTVPVSNALAVDPSQQAAVVTVYPNPATTDMRVKLATPGARLEVHSITGAVLFTTQTATTEAVLDVRQLPAGLYLLLVKSDKGGQTWQRFITQKP